METIDKIIQSLIKDYKHFVYDINGRHKSWEHCYSRFVSARNETSPDIDTLSLNLAFYLASWGMYRGSSFLMQKDYKIHIPAVEIILKNEYSCLSEIECNSYKNIEAQSALSRVSDELRAYYNGIRKQVKGSAISGQISDTLITKILLGTLGCVPAYDRFFICGIKSEKISTGNFNMSSILKLADFYEANSVLLEAGRQLFTIGDIPYPQMKILDMGFWHIGYDNETHGQH